MDRRRFIISTFTVFLAGLLSPKLAFGARGGKFTLAFGSCAQQDDPQPIWDTIRSARPSIFAFLGDNIYADTEDLAEMRAKYEKLAAVPEFTEFRRAIPVVATWDDHDYGQNDAGSEYPQKAGSKELFLDFFGEPGSSERRKRPGVYTSYVWGETSRRVQLILLDLRWFRTSPLRRGDNGEYVPNPDPRATLLGEDQWAWLEKELARPAEVRILASSIQLASSEHRWEKWANFPREKARLFKLLDRLKIRNLVVISGDMHYAELSLDHTPSGTPVYDLTSSGLNYFEWCADKNGKRVALYDQSPTFGLVEVDWEPVTPEVTLEVRDVGGETKIRQRVKLPFARA